MLMMFLFCITAIKCGVDASLKKKKLSPTIDTNKNFVEASHTMTSTCNQPGQNERFEDGLTTERIKCTDVSTRLGKWSHEEYRCAGTCEVFSLSETKDGRI